MATYPPPTETLPTFNSTVFTSPLTDGLTVAEADLRYLKFPSSQGGETINGDLVVSGTITTNDIEPSSASTALDIAGTQVGGTLTIGTDITRTGTIQIGGATGTGVGRTINIGTTSGSGTNTINIGGSTITVGSGNTSFLNVNPNGTSALNLGNNMTGGSIVMGGTTGGTTTITIGNGTAQTGAISIGTGNTSSSLPITIGNQTGAFGSVDIGTTTITVGKSNTATNNIQTSTGGTLNLKTTTTGGAINLGTSMTSGTIVLGGTTGGTTTLTVNRPIAPAYLPSAIGATNIGYQTSSTNNTFTSAVAGVFEVMNTGSITAGVWMVEGCFVFSGAVGGGRRMGLNTTSAVMTDTRTQGVATGSFAQLVVSSIFSFSTATTVYLNIDITAGLGGAGTNISTLRWTRLA